MQPPAWHRDGLPADALDGAAVDYTVRETNRGLEVWVPAGASQRHTLVVTAG